MKYPVLSCTALLFLASYAQAGPVSVSPMMEFGGSGNIPAAGDQSKLVRGPKSVKVEVDTSGLDPLSPYTVWAVIFNDPRYCLSAPCTLADLASAPGHDSRARSSLVNAGDGGVVDADGHGLFFGEIWKAGDGPSGAETKFGPGLLDTRKAEIHLIVRGHGQPTGGSTEVFEAISSFSGGCNAENAVQPPCENQQVSVHLAN